MRSIWMSLWKVKSLLHMNGIGELNSSKLRFVSKWLEMADSQQQLSVRPQSDQLVRLFSLFISRNFFYSVEWTRLRLLSVKPIKLCWSTCEAFKVALKQTKSQHDILIFSIENFVNLMIVAVTRAILFISYYYFFIRLQQKMAIQLVKPFKGTKQFHCWWIILGCWFLFTRFNVAITELYFSSSRSFFCSGIRIGSILESQKVASKWENETGYLYRNIFLYNRIAIMVNAVENLYLVEWQLKLWNLL